MTSVETDEDEAFSLLTIASTPERVRRVIGSQATPGECLVVTWPLALAGATFCTSWSLLNTVVGGVVVGLFV